MLTYVLRERQFQFLQGINPQFPNDATVYIELEPGVPFGGHTGITRHTVRGLGTKARVNLSTGRFVFESSTPLYDPLEATVTTAGTLFQIKGNIALVQSRCTSLQDLADLLSRIYYAFPALLNVYLPDSPVPKYAWGTVGDAKFQWHFEPTEIQSTLKITSKGHQEQLAVASWRRVSLLAQSRRLMGGLHYFHVACRLLALGHNRFEFMAEALLNLAKCLQSLFGESNKKVRSELTRLGSFSSDDIERRFIPALILRSKFDVSHVSLSLLSRDQLKVLHRYTDSAEYAFRELLQQLLERVERGEYTLLPDTPVKLPNEKAAILRRLEKNLKESG
jgi:hypothetical protein